MIDFSFGLFGKRLQDILHDITPTPREYELVYGQVDQLTSVIVNLMNQSLLPPLSAPYISVVGSVFRETALKPIHHVDLLLHIDPSYVEFFDKNLAIKLIRGHQLLSTTTNPSQLIVPQLLLTQLTTQFSSLFEVSLSRSQQSLLLKNPQYLVEFRLTPALQYTNFYLIPEEKSELIWKKIHPYAEKQNFQALNQKHHGHISEVVRIMKFWNEQKNNKAFRNTHLEAITQTIYKDVPSPFTNLFSALQYYVEKLPKFLYNTPDPTGLSDAVHKYLPDTIDRWYLYMNRVESLRNEVAKGESSFTSFLLSKEVESPAITS